MAVLQPGPHLYFYANDCPPIPVQLRQVDKHVLGVFFEGRDDYDLVDEVSGRFEPIDVGDKRGRLILPS